MNKSLFSQHFLETRLADQPEWHEDAYAIFETLRQRWQHARQYAATWNEAQTEDEFVKPILEALGWSSIVQAKSLSRGRVSRPDYALFLDPSSKNAAYPFQGDDDAFYSRTPVIGEAKYWRRELSKKDADRRDDWKASSNPSHQMVSYLVGTRVAWGILTNGAVWRLYSREVSSTASEYYEFDLATVFDALAANQPPDDDQLAHFKQWWLFFRRAAFAPSAQGKSFVQRMQEGSTTYAREISDKLKELVFDEVMPEIAGGFIAYRHKEKGIQQENENDLRQIYQASLSLLYKLLFLLYGEARNLLPMQNPSYQEQSLTELARWAADKRDRQQPLSRSTHATLKYASLLALFHRLDRGDADLSIPRYNGGLFNPANPDNLFLAEHKLSDYAVATAVDILVRDAGQPVDYAYISVRNLGAIYEGLLENKLRVRDAATGKVELVNDKGERKASGSFYTPDYIVKYIVQQTLDPILDERQGQFNEAMDRCVALRLRLQTREVEQAGVNQLLRTELAKAERTAREAFLGIKVCDLAMGSGHFLVNTVDHLTDGIIDRMLAYHATHDVPLAWNPIYAQIDEVRQEIVAEMQRQSITVNPDQLDDTALLTRMVMKRCVYGVDLNPMAVELAKLSLWLHSFTVGAPLSFLDHHLRWGNSLVGSDVRTVENALLSTKQTKSISKAAQKLAAGRGEKARTEKVTYQVNLFGGPFAGLLDLTAIMLEIAQQADSTLADVHASAEKFNWFQASLLPYKQALDLWVSQSFGNTDATEFLETYPTDVLPALRGERKLTNQHLAAIEQAKALGAEKRFFHWDLEFPEVFIDLERRDWAENPGFDAVIGNPPYFSVDSTWGKNSVEASYLKSEYQEIWMGKSDIYYYFFYLGVRVGREGGIVAYITSRYFLEALFAENLRRHLLDTCNLKAVVDFGNLTVFEGVGIKAAISVLQKELEQDKRINGEIKFLQVKGKDDLEQVQVLLSQNQFLKVSQQNVEPDTWNLSLWTNIELSQRIDARCVPLGELCFSGQGMQTGANEVFEVDSKTLEDYKIKSKFRRKLVKNQDIKPYSIEFRDLFLIYPEEIENIEDEIEVLRYLLQHKDKLTERAAYKRGNCEWYKFTWPLHKHRYTAQKIIVPFVAPENRFALDETGEFTGLTDTYAIFPTHLDGISLKYLLAILNSDLLNFRYKLIAKPKDYRYEYFEHTLNKIPIRRIAFTTPIDDRARYAEKGQRLYTQFCAKADYACVLGFVDHHLAQQPEQADGVHDLLAFLAEQMIDLNQQKQTEMKGFLVWLERQIGVAIDQLNNKSAIQQYLGDYQKNTAHLDVDALLALLVKNKRKLTVDPVKRAFQTAVATEYTASLEKLLPLKQQLAATDRLIDQVVYRLYGLSDAEIAVVEG